jgi:arylsulfatase A-like enzyme
VHRTRAADTRDGCAERARLRGDAHRRRRHRVASGLVLLGIATVARVACADCRDAGDLDTLGRSIASAFRCEQQRLRAGSTSCRPTAAPACAGTLVADLVAFAGTSEITTTSEEQRALGQAFRCQHAISNAVKLFAVDRVQSARRGFPGRRADARALPKLRHVAPTCPVLVQLTSAGQRVPNVGAPCDGLLGIGVPIDGPALAECIRVGLGARLEPVLRSSLKPSIILVLTDDQPATMLDPLPTVRMDLIGDHGVTFGEATVTTPLCAPSRASILTGRFAHNHGVVNNYYPNAYFALDDSSTIATWLHDAGYRTGLYGKYENGYLGSAPHAGYTGPLPYVPPGWDEWHAYTVLDFFNYGLIDNNVEVSYGSAEADYATDVLAGKAVDFIRAAGDRPFFLYFAPYAPHDPATPAPRHVGRYDGVPPWRPLSYDEADVSDKAATIRNMPLLSPTQVATADTLYQHMLESLLSVDDAVAAMLQALRETGRDEDTIVVFTSDNGLALGEHRWLGKLCPYEECIRVPFVVRYPRLIGSPRVDERPVTNIDLAPTFAEFAAATPASPIDGTSFASLLDGSATEWRTDMLHELPWGFVPPAYRVVRTDQYVYVEYVAAGFYPPQAELFDLAVDPWELTSVAGDPEYHDVQEALAARMREIAPGWTQDPP